MTSVSGNCTKQATGNIHLPQYNNILIQLTFLRLVHWANVATAITVSQVRCLTAHCFTHVPCVLRHRHSLYWEMSSRNKIWQTRILYYFASYFPSTHPSPFNSITIVNSCCTKMFSRFPGMTLDTLYNADEGFSQCSQNLHIYKWPNNFPSCLYTHLSITWSNYTEMPLFHWQSYRLLKLLSDVFVRLCPSNIVLSTYDKKFLHTFLFTS